MFDKLKLKEALAAYKKDFVNKEWPGEKYKWEAVKHFQENWDVNAGDFAHMLEESLALTSNLLTSAKNFPALMIKEFAEAAPEEVRSMFLELFDESKDAVERVENFKRRAGILLERYGNGAAQHYQNENAIMTYLWLRYPDRYYIYKFGEIKTVASKLMCGYRFKKGAYADNLRNFMALYDEIREELKQDDELKGLLKSQLTDTCYPDPELRTLTVDVGFYISRYYGENKGADSEDGIDAVRYWLFAPGSGAEKWEECCKNGIMLLGWGEIGDLAAFKSKDEIKQKMNDIYGNDSPYTNSVHATWQFVHDMKPGDIVFVKKGVNEILGRGVVESEYEYDAGRSDNFNNIRRVKWTHKGDWVIAHQSPQKTLTDITPYPDFLNQITELFDDKSADTNGESGITYHPYTKSDFLAEVYISEAKYERLAAVLKKKKNIILQGAPGVGKTFAAKRLAYSIMGEKDDDRIEFVQFHQNYSYEDFVMGYKPDGEGFELKYGVFYRFCQKAADNPDKDYFFIIDEINRGNLSKIFGELLMLIEADYRDTKVTLAYNGLTFSVPKRLHIIGMMNTADRSLAMIDYALRRRFSFFDMEPGFDSEGFLKYQEGLHNETFNALIGRIRELNRDISQDKSLGKGFCIGHSYFCGEEECTDEWMKDVVDFDVIPMLEEYWFDDGGKLQRWKNILRGVFQ